jgi:hypothetical protein
MAIVLRDLRVAFANYLDTKVTVSIALPVPAAGAGQLITPNEEFTFGVTVTNSTAGDGLRLKNVRYAIDYANAAVADLIVPPAPMVARSNSSATSPVLTPGSRVDAMVLFPPDEKNALEPGETESISLRGRTGSSPSSTNIRFRVLADPDLDYFFPKDQDTITALRPLTVNPT